MIRTLAFLLGALTLAAAAVPDQHIRAVLERQQAAWNSGDIRGFMEGYADECAFVGATVTRGHDAVMDRYLKRYPTRDKMGALAFSGIEIQQLGLDYASVLGKWHLDRSADAGGPAGGIFTLLFHKTEHGWKIILDHTS